MLSFYNLLRQPDRHVKEFRTSLADVDKRLGRLYEGIETGGLELDDQLRSRINALKTAHYSEQNGKTGPLFGEDIRTLLLNQARVPT